MNVACCEDGCRGIPNDNVPLFVSHLILVTLSTASWILCAAVLKDDWPTQRIHDAVASVTRMRWDTKSGTLSLGIPRQPSSQHATFMVSTFYAAI